MIAATLLALAAACGSGQAGPAQKQFRTQTVADLDTENGLLDVTLTDTCLSLDTMTVTTDTTLDPSAGTDTTSCGTNYNGMVPNLLGLNGLQPNGLQTQQFDKWFTADPVTANKLMQYLVKCSLPYATTLTYTADDGSVYQWAGYLGLAPRWANGEAIPEEEQELVSACLAAHANKYGVHVPISVLGAYADGTPIPASDDELAAYPVTEGCFFGNLFHNDGVFSGDNRAISLGEEDSSLRACALADRTGGGASSNCPPIQYAGNCRDVCQLDATGLYYTSCTVNGKSYRPLSTRIQPNVNYTCGDGVCQITEQCGTGTTWNNCGLDCGPCN